MKARLDIRAAIEFYNKNKRGEDKELSASSLARLLFADTKSGDNSKIVLFYQIINNKRRFVDLNWLAKIAEITGYPPEKLIIYTQNPINYGRDNQTPGTQGENDQSSYRES